MEGYVAEPLDAIWLKAPYLHNGSVPTLADLLQPVDQRPKTFVRGGTIIDQEKIGFVAPPCVPGRASTAGFCYDTDDEKQPGNSRAGHTYGTTLPAQDKKDLIAYLSTL